LSGCFCADTPPDAKLQHRGQEYRHLAYSILASGCVDALIEEEAKEMPCRKIATAPISKAH
jgi:hypothetical protein